MLVMCFTRSDSELGVSVGRCDPDWWYEGNVDEECWNWSRVRRSGMDENVERLKLSQDRRFRTSHQKWEDMPRPGALVRWRTRLIADVGCVRYVISDEVGTAGCEARVDGAIWIMEGGGDREVGRDKTSISMGISNVPSRLIIGGSSIDVFCWYWR